MPSEPSPRDYQIRIGRIVGFEPRLCHPRQRATRLHYLSDDLGMPG